MQVASIADTTLLHNGVSMPWLGLGVLINGLDRGERLGQDPDDFSF